MVYLCPADIPACNFRSSGGDPDVRGQADRTTSRTQITRFGMTSDGHPTDQVADRIGGYLGR
jgi:hypothetical protein